MRPSAPEILIIVPAYNEEGNLKNTLEEILAVNLRKTVLVIDDGSSDRTSHIAQEMKVNLIRLPFNLGIGGAVQTGFKFASEKQFNLAVQIDGDGQHDARFLGLLIEPILNEEADLVIGSRFFPPYLGYRSSFVRRIGIHFFAKLISFLTGTIVTDPTSGFRAYNRHMIELFARDYPQDFPEPEAIILAKQIGAQIKEVPVKMRKRNFGYSSIRYLKTLYYMSKVTFAILLDTLKR